MQREYSQLRQYITLFRIRFIAGLQYRVAAVAGIMTQFAWGGMTVLLYRAFYQADPSAFPQSFESMCSYIWIQQAFLAIFMVWGMDPEPFNLIKSGDIAYELCRPVSIYWMWFVKSAAIRLAKAVLRCMPLLIFALLLPHPYRLILPDAGRLLLFAGSVLLALVNIVAFTMLIYISTFYTLDSTGLRSLLSTLAEFLSGGLIPLPFFPDSLQRILALLPFAGMENTPLQLYNGTLTGSQAVFAIGMQMLWATVMIGTGVVWMRRALKNVVAQGG